MPPECQTPADICPTYNEKKRDYTRKRKSCLSVQQSLQFFPEAVQDADLGGIHRPDG